MAASGALIASTANAALESALADKLSQRAATGHFGELEPLAIRLGLIQNSLRPRFESPRIVVFAGDHGLAVDGISPSDWHSSERNVRDLLDERLPLAMFARIHGLELTVVDGGIAETVAPHPRLITRKIGHGTRNSRVAAAMSTDQAHAAIRAGMEIGKSLSGSAVACAAIGNGSVQSAALLLSCLSGLPVREFVDSGPGAAAVPFEHVLQLLEGSRSRHAHLTDPVEMLAAVGGFEIAMMAGLMLAAASRRRLIIPDGIAACAALRVATVVAPAVSDYCVHARSNWHPGLDRALELFGAQPLIGLVLDSIDGTGATLAWPLIRSAAALLVDEATGRTDQ